MKTLSDKITISVSVPQSAEHNKVYSYTVYSKLLDETIFIGNLFYQNGTTLSVDITDLARNYAFNASNYAEPNNNYWRVENTNLMDVYTVSINWGDSTTSGNETVVHVYEYPNKYKTVNASYNDVFFNPTTPNTGITNCTMQGLYYNSRYQHKYPLLIPRYPLYEVEQAQDESKIPFYSSIEIGNNVTALNFYYVDSGDLDEEISIDVSSQYSNTVVIYGNIYVFQYPQGWTPESDVILSVESTNRTENAKRIAIFEPNYKRYYLQWQDRFGNMQSQPFNCNIDYNENFEREEIVNADGQRKLTGITVKPKWKLNSGWIDEDIFWEYESIYTSPFVNLVDTKHNSVISVMVTGNYEEKNYKNQKKMINLNLELEGATNQKYIY